MNEDSFKTTIGFKSYVNKTEVTSIDPRYLVKGSKNVLIDYAQRIVSRNGYILYRQANNGGGGIKSSYEWDNSTGGEFSMRVYDGRLEFDWNGTYNLLKSGFATSRIEFTKIWDNTEKIDVLLMAAGDTNTYKWSGATTKLWKSTSTTLTKQGVLTAVSTIAFVAGTPGSVAATITDSMSNFLNAGFASGDILQVTGSTNNSRNFLIGSVTAGTITLAMKEVLVTESAGTTVTLHNGQPTWSSARFLTTGTRKINYMGVDYAYTGGEATDTLTGLTAFPTVSVGDFTWQTIQVLANPGSISNGFKQDLIGVELNQLQLASTKSQEIFISSTLDYTDFTLTSPRAPGDPAKVVMDQPATGIIPADNLAQTLNTTLFGGGKNEFFRLDYKMSQDNTNELVRMLKLKTSSGSGIISRGAICSIKNATAYISREPTLDTLGTIENQENAKNVPLSDPIKNDFDSYDFEECHMKYWKRAIYTTVPALGLLLIYDLQRSLWQPPQTIPVGRLAIISDWLYGHSFVTNETYKLFTGTNDNGNFIPQVARFAYNNGGRRDRIKSMSEYWTDGYINAAATLNMTQYFGFEGELGKKVMTFSGGDSSVVSTPIGSHIGDETLGIDPLGGATLDAIPGINGTNAPLLRFHQIDTMKQVDYFESFVEYSMNTLDGQFAIVSHGSNQWDAGTNPSSIKK